MSVSILSSFEYLERLPGTTFIKLYQQPSTALAIFRRMLPHLAKMIVMALLYMTEPLHLSDLDLWVKAGSKKSRDKGLATLVQLHMIKVTAATKEQPQTVVVTPSFGSSLRLALTGSGDHGSFGVPTSTEVIEGIDVDFLDHFSTSQWEGILHYVVNSVGVSVVGGNENGPRDTVKRLLEAGNLVRRGRGSGGGITKDGFTFLLQESNAQVWNLLLLWIENAEKMNLDSVEIFSFLFMLGSLELGRPYSTGTLTTSQKLMLAYLVDFGLVYVPSSNPTQFFPTRLATTLNSDASALRSVSAGFDAASDGAASGSKFIIIETNYRVYAYTTSPLQIAVLALFTKFITRYPNLVSGRIVRESVARAIEHGITADQIISYLSTHAHPQLAKRAAAVGGPVLPPTVVDQIRLWQMENERMKTSVGFLFKDFETQKEYDDIVGYAEEIGVLQWKGEPTKRMFFASRHEQVRDYIKARKAKQ